MTKRTSINSVRQSRNSQEYRRIEPDKFVQAAKEILELGWHPLPLGGPKGKDLLAIGVTGNKGVDVTDEEKFRKWADEWAHTANGLNLATRLPIGTVALDVDCYNGKPGAETIAACETEWGELPPTWTITARCDGSGKMLYRVPEDWKGVGAIPSRDGKTGSGVEVLQRHHRYAVVPPSIHDLGPVLLFGPDGDQCDCLPMPDELPMLPEAWREGLRKFHSVADRDPSAEPEDLLTSFEDGAMSEAVQKAADKALAAIRSGVERHDSLNGSLLMLMKLGRCGATGVPLAVTLVRNEFLEMRRNEGEGPEGEAEFRRSLDGAAQLAAKLSPSIAGALQPGGIWHKDTRWVRDPKDGGLLVRGVHGLAGDGKPAARRFATVSARDLAQSVPPMEWLVRGVWPRNSFGPMGGEKKTLKSYNLLSMSVAVASGEPLFGEFKVESPGPVVYYVGEGGRAPFQRRVQAIARAYGVSLADLPLHAVFDVGSLDSPEFTDALKRNLDEIQPQLVILDPLYAFHPSGVEAQNLYERGRMLAELSAQTANETALVVADHFRKTGSAELDLDSISQSGMGQWADSWILQKHREKADLANGRYQLAVNRPGFRAAPMLATSPVGKSMVERSAPPRTGRG